MTNLDLDDLDDDDYLSRLDDNSRAALLSMPAEQRAQALADLRNWVRQTRHALGGPARPAIRPKGRGWDEWEDVFLRMGNAERPSAVLRHRDEIDDRAYWSAVRMAWSDSDRASLPHQLWASMFEADRPGREHLMTDGERADLASLPERVEVYRGVNPTNSPAGLSWTLDPERAEWFARRFPWPGQRAVITGRVLRERIIALIDERNEREVLVFPRYVRDRRTRTLDE